MQLDEIIKRLSEPERLIDPQEINYLQVYLNEHITALEDEEWERQLVASNKLAELSEKETVGKSEILWKVSNEFRLWKGIERTVKKLKRYRADLKDRMNILMNKKY